MLKQSSDYSIEAGLQQTLLKLHHSALWDFNLRKVAGLQRLPWCRVTDAVIESDRPAGKSTDRDAYNKLRTWQYSKERREINASDNSGTVCCSATHAP